MEKRNGSSHVHLTFCGLTRLGIFGTFARAKSEKGIFRMHVLFYSNIPLKSELIGISKCSHRFCFAHYYCESINLKKRMSLLFIKIESIVKNRKRSQTNERRISFVFHVSNYSERKKCLQFGPCVN